jgi:hypothetical protein
VYDPILAAAMLTLERSREAEEAIRRAGASRRPSWLATIARRIIRRDGTSAGAVQQAWRMTPDARA